MPPRVIHREGRGCPVFGIYNICCIGHPRRGPLGKPFNLSTTSIAQAQCDHLSTVRILQLLVEYGVDTPDGFQKLAPCKLTASPVNRHLRRLGDDDARMIRHSPAVRFQAERLNALRRDEVSLDEVERIVI